MDPAILGRATVALAVFLGSLGFVTWRQRRALETLAELDQLYSQVSVARAQVIELDREIQVLTSRAQIVPRARAALEMHTPDGSEQVILAIEHPS